MKICCLPLIILTLKTVILTVFKVASGPFNVSQLLQLHGFVELFLLLSIQTKRKQIRAPQVFHKLSKCCTILEQYWNSQLLVSLFLFGFSRSKLISLIYHKHDMSCTSMLPQATTMCSTVAFRQPILYLTLFMDHPLHKGQYCSSLHDLLTNLHSETS